MSGALHLERVLGALPPFTGSCFHTIRPAASTQAEVSCTCSVHIFFRFLVRGGPICGGCAVRRFRMRSLRHLRPMSVRRCRRCLGICGGSRRGYVAGARGKLTEGVSTLHDFCKCCFGHRVVDGGPALLIRVPGVRRGTVVQLSASRVTVLLSCISRKKSGLANRQGTCFRGAGGQSLTVLALLLKAKVHMSRYIKLSLRSVSFGGGKVAMAQGNKGRVIICFNRRIRGTLGACLCAAEGRAVPLSNRRGTLFLSARQGHVNIRTIRGVMGGCTERIAPGGGVAPRGLHDACKATLCGRAKSVCLITSILKRGSIGAAGGRCTTVSRSQHHRTTNTMGLHRM